MSEQAIGLIPDNELAPFMVRHPSLAALEVMGEYDLNQPEYWSRLRRMFVMGTFVSEKQTPQLMISHARPTSYVTNQFNNGNCKLLNSFYSDFTKISQVSLVDGSSVCFVGDQPNANSQYVVLSDIDLNKFIMNFESNFARLFQYTNRFIREAGTYADGHDVYPQVMDVRGMSVSADDLDLLRRLGFVNDYVRRKGRSELSRTTYINTEELIRYTQELKLKAFIFPENSDFAEIQRKVIEATPLRSSNTKKMILDVVGKVIPLRDLGVERLSKLGVAMTREEIMQVAFGKDYDDSCEGSGGQDLFEANCIKSDFKDGHIVYDKMSIDIGSNTRLPVICRCCSAQRACSRLRKYAKTMTDQDTVPEAKYRLKEFWVDLSKAMSIYNCIIQI